MYAEIWFELFVELLLLLDSLYLVFSELKFVLTHIYDLNSAF